MAGRGFLVPIAIEQAADGTLYVLNRSGERPSGAGVETIGQRIGMLTLDEQYLGEFGEGDFVWAVDLALDREGLVYVSDESRDTVSVYDQNGERLAEWDCSSSELGKLAGPAGLAFDGEDNLYIAEGRAHRVRRVTKDGQYLGGWGARGDDEGRFERPWGLCVDADGDVYVADWGNDRVQKFTQDGKHLVSFGGSNVRRRSAPTWDAVDLSGEFPGSLNHPACVAVDSLGDVYVTDWGTKRVQVYEPDGRFITSLWGEATDWSRWAQERMDANPDLRKGMRRVSPIRLAEMGRFFRPTGIMVDQDDRVIVAESQHHRLQVYQKVADYVEPQFNL